MKIKFLLISALSFLTISAFSQNYLMDGNPITDCSGFFMDSGGGMNPYGPDENFETVICPDGSSGTHIQLVFNNAELGGGDDICFFDGEDTMAPSLGCASDFGGNSSFIIQATAPNLTGCLTLVFSSDASDEGAGWSADINCIPSCQLIQSIIASSDPEIMPVDTGYIDICPGDRVFLTGTGSYPQDGIVYNHSDFTSSFEWDFGDGLSGLGPNVTHVYDEPGGYTVQLTITDQLGCKNTNFISQRIRVSTYPEFNLAGDLDEEICAGDTIQLNAIVNQLDSAHNVSVLPVSGDFIAAGVRSDSLALPDGDGASYETSISFSDFAPGQVLTDINDLLSICVVMEHSWMRDLQISLTCPSGETVILHNHPGQFGGEVYLGVPNDNDGGFPIPGLGYEYCWTPEPPNPSWIDYANANLPQTLPPGDYASFEPLETFLGCPLNGEWTITVTDLWAIDNGFIFEWSINFNEDLYPSIETFTPNFIDWSWSDHPSIYFQTQDSINASPENAGTASYTFQVDNDFGCSFDTMVNFQILPFTHPNCHNCADNLTPADDVAICEGDQVDFDVSAQIDTDLPITFEAFPNYDFGATNHPPANPYESTININSIIPTSIADPMVDIASICLDIETDFAADINIRLRTPTGQLFELSTGNGGGQDNYTQTCFTPSAVTPIQSGSPPFTGDFIPEDPWSTITGAPTNGNWSILVSDAFGLTTFSKLNWWSITFNTTNEIEYNWFPPVDLSCTDCPNPTANPSQTTNYIVTSTDAFNCVYNDEVEIAVLQSIPAPVLSFNSLFGGTLEINWTQISSFTEYEINIDNGGWIDSNNGSFSHLIAGLANGATVNVQIRVKLADPDCTIDEAQDDGLYLICNSFDAFISGGATENLCFGDCEAFLPISAVNGTAPFTYTANYQVTGDTWSQNAGNFTGLCAGDYVFIVEDAAGCMDTINHLVVEPPELTVVAMEADQVSCFGGNDGCALATGNGGTGTYSFVWDNPNMSPGANVCNLEAAGISVTITDVNGCEATSSTIITQPSAISLTTSKTDVLCFGENTGTGTVIPMGGVGNFTYNWSSGTEPDQSTTGGLPMGIHSVTVTDSNGCQAFENVTVNQPNSAVTVSVDQTLLSCFQENSSEATATPIGGTGTNYSYQWMPSNQNAQVALGLSNQNYSVTVTDENDCTAVGDLDIEELDEMNVLINFQHPTCGGVNDGQMAVTNVTGGCCGLQFPGGYQTIWDNGGDTPFIDNLEGNMSYTVTVTDPQGCSTSSTASLDDPLPMEITLAETPASCFNGNDGTAIVTNVINGGQMIEYQWDATTGSQITATASNLNAGTYSVTVSDEQGCSANETITVGEPTDILIEFAIIDNECNADEQGAINTSVSGGISNYSYAWSTGSDTTLITNLPAGQYVLTVTDGNNCEKIEVAEVDEPAPIEAIITPKDVTCFGDRDGSITIEPVGGTPPFTYSLDGENFFGSSTLIGLEEGIYNVHVRDGNGCEWDTDVTIESPPEFTIELVVNTQPRTEYTVVLGDSVRVFVRDSNNVGNIDIIWSPSYCGTMHCQNETETDCDKTLTCNGPWSVPENPVTYHALAIDENGCEAEASINILLQKERTVLVPTGFSPNQDSNNDLLLVHGQRGTVVKTFRVFDRWGELLYEALEFPVNDAGIGWDGTFKGTEMPAGVYVWYAEVQFIDGMEDSYKGNTTLIR